MPPEIKEYADNMQRFYQAQVMPRLSVEEINRWVDQRTMHMIPKLLDGLREDTDMVLVSALYFYGSWVSPFAERLTAPEPFTTALGNSQQVSMMRHGEPKHLPYIGGNNQGFQSIVMKYGQGAFEAFIVLPDQVIANQQGWEPILAKVGSNPHDFREQHRGERTRVYLPKFKVESSLSLLKKLKDLEPAQGSVFESPVLHPSARIGDVVHKVVVDVNEKGTEAAAATAVARCLTLCVEPDPIEFRVNRPFLFAIYAPAVQEVLFMGIVNEIPE